MADEREEAIKRLSEKRAEDFEARAEQEPEPEDVEEEAEEAAEPAPPKPEPAPEPEPEPPAAHAGDDDLQRRLDEIAALEARPADTGSLDELEQKYLDAVNEGEFEEAFRIQKQYNQADRARLMQDVTFQIDQREATRNFKRDYDHIYQDPYLFGIANQQIQSMTARGVNIVEAADLAGRSVKQWLDKQAPDRGTGRTERHERKRRTVVDIPRASGRATAAPAEPEPTPADMIQRMKEKRGQVV